MAAVRQERDGESLPKTPNLCDGEHHRKVMKIEKLVGLKSQNKNSSVRRTLKMKKKTTKDTKNSGTKKRLSQTASSNTTW